MNDHDRFTNLNRDNEYFNTVKVVLKIACGILYSALCLTPALWPPSAAEMSDFPMPVITTSRLISSSFFGWPMLECCVQTRIRVDRQDKDFGEPFSYAIPRKNSSALLFDFIFFLIALYVLFLMVDVLVYEYRFRWWFFNARFRIHLVTAFLLVLTCAMVMFLNFTPRSNFPESGHIAYKDFGLIDENSSYDLAFTFYGWPIRAYCVCTSPLKENPRSLKGYYRAGVLVDLVLAGIVLFTVFSFTEQSARRKP